ncbi:DUF7483 domain-containing protein [Azospirillum cavernae]|uniref:DUF7483 domain-containing protein n=1 Tax=Azospirillum cavernae TaxID=2320860 RepID=UPI000E6B584B|nr:hypothetical protein [Azospirillum cavernae]
MMQIDMILSQVTGSDARGLVIPTAWNPLDKGSDVTLSNANLTVNTTNGPYDASCYVRSVASVSASTATGYYWEVRCNDATNSETFGVATSAWAGAHSGSGFWGARRTIGSEIYRCGSGISIDNVASAVKQVGDVYQFALKNGCLHVGLNGVWIGASDPVANTAPLWSGITGSVYAAVTDHDNSSSTNVTANFGASAFVYPIPTGYTAGFGVLQGVFATTLYTGNGSAQNILNGVDLLGSGGLVVTKARSNAANASVWIDTARGGSSTLFSNSQSAAATDGAAITGFTGDGYSVGGASSLNAASDSLVSWAFRQSPRFFKPVVVNHTNGTASVVDLSSLGTVGMTITKTTTKTNHWWVNHRSFPATGFASLDTSGGVQAGDTWTLGANSLTISADSETQTYIVYAFGHDVAEDGQIQCGVYTEGSSDVNVALGWPAQFVLTKPKDASGNWWVVDTARGFDKGLRLNTTDADVSAAYYAQHSNGFTAKAGNFGANTQIVYMAIRAS